MATRVATVTNGRVAKEVRRTLRALGVKFKFKAAPGTKKKRNPRKTTRRRRAKAKRRK